jgi:hypothetical protein
VSNDEEGCEDEVEEEYTREIKTTVVEVYTPPNRRIFGFTAIGEH